MSPPKKKLGREKTQKSMTKTVGIYTILTHTYTSHVILTTQRSSFNILHNNTHCLYNFCFCGRNKLIIIIINDDDDEMWKICGKEYQTHVYASKNASLRSSRRERYVLFLGGSEQPSDHIFRSLIFDQVLFTIQTRFYFVFRIARFFLFDEQGRADELNVFYRNSFFVVMRERCLIKHAHTYTHTRKYEICQGSMDR